MPHLVLEKVATAATAARDGKPDAINAFRNGNGSQRSSPSRQRAPALGERLPDDRGLAMRSRVEFADRQRASMPPERMGNEAMSYADRPLQGEKVSIGSSSRASGNLWPTVSLWGAMALWGAPILLLSRYQPDQLLGALADVSLKPTGSGLLTLALMLTYVVLTGLMLGMVARLPRRKASRVLLRIVLSPLLTLSLIAALITAVPLFLGTLVMYFPSLI